MYYFIVNPASKTGGGIKIWRNLKAILKENGTCYKAFATTPEKTGDFIIRTLLNKISDPELNVIVLGGDGTVNEVISGISDENFKRVRLGYIPTGSSNDLARALDITESPEERLKHLINSNAYRMMDLGLVTYNKEETLGYKKRYFAVSMGIGYDAAVCHEALNSTMKKTLNKFHLGKLSYGLISFKQLISTPVSKCEMTVDEDLNITVDRCYFVTVMNHCFQGGGIKFCPDAVDNDGLLNTCYAYDISKAKVMYAIPQAFYGNHVGMKGIGNDICKSIRIVFDKPLWVHTDGEVKTMASDVTVSCAPGILKFMI